VTSHRLGDKYILLDVETFCGEILLQSHCGEIYHMRKENR
jgi:hypothetical protein